MSAYGSLRIPQHLTAHVQRIAIGAGQQCIIQGSGVVRLSLVDGVIEIAGALLHAKCEYTFNLQPTQNRNIVLYSLEGGTVAAFREQPPYTLDIIKNTAAISPIVEVVRDSFQKGKRCVVAVAGGPQCGKTLAACTAGNTLANLCKRQENSTGNTPGVLFADATGSGSMPASLVCTELVAATSSSANHSSSPPLWPGSAASPLRFQAASFWLGLQQSEISSTHMAWYLNVLKQLEAATESVAAKVKNDTQKSHVVYDLPAPDDSIPKELFYKHVLQCVHPTMVLLIKGSQTEAEGEGSVSWVETLKEDLRRTSPSIQVVVTDLQLRNTIATTSGAALTRALTDYFGGTIEHPLRAGKVVAPLSALRWFRVAAVAEPQASSSSWATEVVSSASIVAGSLCAVSLARLDVEIPFADVAGVAVVVRVDKEADEVVLFVPSGEELPNNILVLPPMVAAEGKSGGLWHLSPTQLATLESIEG